MQSINQLAAVALLVCLCAAAFAQTTGQTIRHHRVPESETPDALTLAEAALEKKDYATAEPLLRQAVAAHPDDYRAWFDLGFLLKATGRKTESIQAYRKSVGVNPTVFESNLSLGLMLAQDGDPEAERFLRAATRLKPSARPEEGLERAWLALGGVLAATKPEEALAAYAEAARLQPKDPEPRLAAGMTLEKQNKLVAAAGEYSAAAELDPKSEEAAAGLANVYQKSGQMPEAETALRKYINLNPGNATAHVQLGRVLAAERKPDAAITEFEAALNLSPHDPDAHTGLAALSLETKKYGQAETNYRLLLKMNPNDGGAHWGLGRALMQQRRFAEAQRELMAAVTLDASLGEGYGDLAIVASENHDYALTLRALAARARLLPEVPGTYFLRATAYDHLKDAKHAAENYRQFLQVAKGKFPEQEWQAKHRLKAIDAGGVDKKK